MKKRQHRLKFETVSVLDNFLECIFPPRCFVCDRLLETADIRRQRNVHAATTNKVAPKFQIENTSSTGKTWEQARDICAGKGNNWRLPTQREMYLALSLGASVLSNNNQGFGSSTTWTGNGFQEISGVHWTLTDRDGNYWLVGENSAVFGAWPQGGAATWARYRCVRTVE